MHKVIEVLAIGLLAFSWCVATAQPQSSTAWVRREKTDRLRDITYATYSLTGKFLTPPANGSLPNPVMVVHCLPGKVEKKGVHGYTNGKFTDGFIQIGSVVDSEEANGSGVAVNFRLDDGKVRTEEWGRSTNFSAIYFASPFCDYCAFANLLYGHGVLHKENTNPQVRKVVIGVSEYLGGEVVMQFDMPDATEVAEGCGIVLHK